MTNYKEKDLKKEDININEEEIANRAYDIGKEISKIVSGNPYHSILIGISFRLQLL